MLLRNKLQKQRNQKKLYRHKVILKIMKSAASSDFSLEEIRKAVSKTAARYGVDEVYLFGSRARGDYEEGSDFDFCIKPGRIEDLIKLGCFINELETELGKSVDVITESSMSEEFAQEVMRDRVMIYKIEHHTEY